MECSPDAWIDPKASPTTDSQLQIFHGLRCPIILVDSFYGSLSASFYVEPCFGFLELSPLCPSSNSSLPEEPFTFLHVLFLIKLEHPQKPSFLSLKAYTCSLTNLINFLLKLSRRFTFLENHGGWTVPLVGSDHSTIYCIYLEASYHGEGQHLYYFSNNHIILVGGKKALNLSPTSLLITFLSLCAFVFLCMIQRQRAVQLSLLSFEVLDGACFPT